MRGGSRACLLDVKFMERIIIDTDPGTDDAFAIILVAKEENIHIEGLQQ